MRRTSRVMVSAAALFLTSGTGVAGATPDTTGMTYAKAKETLASTGLTVVVSTAAGSHLSQDDCIVVNQQVRDAVKFGQDEQPKKILVSLNCYGSVASANKPGNSVASPEGKKAEKLKAEEDLKWRQTTPEGQQWCADTLAGHPDWHVDGCPQ